MVECTLERGQMVLFHRAGGAVDAPLTDGHMRLEAVLGGSIAGEVLDRQDDRTLVQAVVAVLVALDEGFGDVAGHIGALAVSTVGAGPAGVGGHVHLRAVHDVQALGLHHLSVSVGHFINEICVAVSQHRCSDAQRVRVADVDGVGVQRVRNCHAALAGFVFQHLGARIVVQRHHTGLAAHITAVNARRDVLVQHIGVVNAHGHAGQRAGDGLFVRVVVLVDLAKLRLAVSTGSFGAGGGHRGVEQGVQHKTSLLVQAQMGHHILCALFGAEPPVLIGGQLAAVVHILEVQAVPDDDAAGGHTDVGAVFVVEDHRLQVTVGDALPRFQSIGCRNDTVAGVGPLGSAGVSNLHLVSPFSCAGMRS